VVTADFIGIYTIVVFLVVEVQQNFWLHLPAEKSVLLHKNVLSEYPGIPCLVALQRDNAALTFCSFFRIEGPEVTLRDQGVREAVSPAGVETYWWWT